MGLYTPFFFSSPFFSLIALSTTSLLSSELFRIRRFSFPSYCLIVLLSRTLSPSIEDFFHPSCSLLFSFLFLSSIFLYASSLFYSPFFSYIPLSHFPFTFLPLPLFSLTLCHPLLQPLLYLNHFQPIPLFSPPYPSRLPPAFTFSEVQKLVFFFIPIKAFCIPWNYSFCYFFTFSRILFLVSLPFPLQVFPPLNV